MEVDSDIEEGEEQAVSGFETSLDEGKVKLAERPIPVRMVIIILSQSNI